MPGRVQAIPDTFCWTRFGTEAGETIEEILERKERERRAGEGTFFWGVGNSVAPGLAAILERCDRPDVLFSPIRGRPRAVDRAPATRYAWTAGSGLDGERFELPATAQVTSGGPADRQVRTHYALVCASSRPLAIDREGPEINFQAMRNLLSGNPLGASQVTAVVRLLRQVSPSDVAYPVTMRAQLVPPYFVRLTDVAAVAIGERAYPEAA